MKRLSLIKVLVLTVIVVFTISTGSAFAEEAVKVIVAGEQADQVKAEASSETPTKVTETENTPTAQDPNRPQNNGPDNAQDRGQRIDRGDYGSRGRRGSGPGQDQGRFRGMERGGAPGQPGQSSGGKKGAFTEEDGLISINLNNIEMKDVIKTIGDWTKKPIIPTTDEVLKLHLTIYASEKMTREKALSLIYAALRTKGYIAEHSEDRIYIKPIAQARVGSVPTLGINEPLAKMEDLSQIVEKFFELDNYSPTKLAEIILPLTAEYGHVTAMESTGSIAVIDTVENLIRIERIINQLDVPESDQIIEKVFKIKNADPMEISQVIMLILEDNQQGRSSRGPSRRPPTPQKGASQPASSVIIEGVQVEAKLLPLPRQNWIIARASADDMLIIEEWIKRLDIEESVSQEQTVIPVRFVDASEIVSIVKRTIQSMPGSELRANLVVEALRQSKQIVVFGSEENRKMVERIIAEVDLPTDDIFIEKTFKLKHADPDQIKENIEELFDNASSNYNPYRRYGGYGSSSSSDEDTVKAIAYTTLSQVTVIASEANMKKIAIQIAEWDVPLDIEKDQYRILTLRNSDPVQMVALLSKLFSEDSSSSGSQGIMRMIFGGGRGMDEQKQKIVGSLYGLLTFEAVPDTKKIIVISKISEAYDVIEKLVNELDSQEIAEVPKVITLKYADAEQLSEQLNAILNEPGTSATIRRSDRGLSVDSDSSDAEKTGEEAVQDNNNNNNDIRPWWDGQRRNDDEMPASNLIGNVRFVPVHRSKAIMVLAPPEYMESIEKMIEELDQPGKQVMIKASIVTVNHSDLTSLGVQIATDPTAFGTLGENALSGLTQLSNLGSIGSVALDSTLNVSTLIDLLVKKIDAKILNEPTLWTKDNEEAVFIKAQNVAFIVADQQDRTNPDSLSRNFEYRDVGVTLRIRPNITPENEVDTSIYLEVATVEEDLINSQIATNKLDTTTHVIIGDGETILLGGILFQVDSTIKRKVPLLGDIPLLGHLFRHESKDLVNQEMLVFITPYVIDGDQTTPEALEQIERPKTTLDEISKHLDQLLRDGTENQE